MLAPPESRPGRLQSGPLARPPAFLCGTQGPGLPLQLPCSPPGASLDIQGTWGGWGSAEMARPGLVHPPSQPLRSSCWSSLPRGALSVCHRAGPWGDTLTVWPWAPGSVPPGTSEGPHAGQRGGTGPWVSAAPGDRSRARARTAPSPQPGPVRAAGSAPPVSFPSGSSRLSCGAWSAAPASCGLTPSLRLPCGLLLRWGGAAAILVTLRHTSLPASASGRLGLGGLGFRGCMPPG